MKNHLTSSIRHQQGFGSVMVIIIVVILAGLAAAIVRLGATQQLTSSQDVLSSRAWAAARSGNEWGLYKALSSASVAANDPFVTCSNLSSTLNLSATTGFWVTVTCNSSTFNEGETAPAAGSPSPNVVRVYVIQATACNSSTSCPDPAMATTSGYVERVRQVTATNLTPL